MNPHHTFKSTFLPYTSCLARHKINNKVILCLASQEGSIDIFSVSEDLKKDQTDTSQKIKIVWSVRMTSLVHEHGPLTKIFYHKDVWLVLATFKGMLQVYDSMEFKLLWETSNLQRKEKTTITTFDFSEATGFIACGGVEGKLLMFDPSARIMTGSCPKAHTSEIMEVYFYDKHMQLLSVSIDRNISLWDSLKLECIQVVKDHSH